MKSPIVVYDHGDVSIFESVDDAQRYLESPDVMESRYEAYDSEGRLLALTVPKIEKAKLLGIEAVKVERVIISDSVPEQLHDEALKQILSKFLKHLGVPLGHIEDATLKVLLTQCIDRVGFTR